MEKFRKQLINRIILLIIAALVFIIVYLIIRFNNLSLNTDMLDFQNGLVAGFSVSVAISTVIMYLKSRNEKKLRNYMINSTDERNIEISYKVTSRSFYVNIILIAFASMISACFSEVITGTLFVVLIVMILVYALNHFIINRMY